MADNPEEKTAGNLPPKLDLRKMGVLKTEGATSPAPIPSKPVALPHLPPTSSVMGATAPITISPAGSAPRPAGPTTPPSAKPSTIGITRPGASPTGRAMGPLPTVPPPASGGMVVKTPTERKIPVTEPQVQTVHIKIPKMETAAPAAPHARSEAPTVMAQDTIPTRPPSESKKDTSKIPLAAAKPAGPTITATPPTEGPKTIRIKPKPATAQTQQVAQPGILATVPVIGADQDGLSEKRKTSRISLEAALTPEQVAATAPASAAADAARPKTIRLKRPSEAATVKVSAPPAAAPDEAAMSMAPSAPGQVSEQEPLVPTAASLEETSRLDLPPATEGEEGSPTRRKTIRVKRPTQRPEVPMPVGTVPGAADLMMPGRRQAMAPVRVPEPHVTFSVFAIITALVIIVTIYLFCSEALGPNPCLTEYSYYKEGPDLGWPGKIQPIRTR